jgi:hypothetical protein
MGPIFSFWQWGGGSYFLFFILLPFSLLGFDLGQQPIIDFD